jgi:acetoin utilization deacetylase AcuC-like enzyme
MAYVDLFAHAAATCRPFNLTTRGIQSCVAKVVAAARPLLILGGGGYCSTATARLWTVLTATAIGEDTAAGLNES